MNMIVRKQYALIICTACAKIHCVQHMRGHVPTKHQIYKFSVGLLNEASYLDGSIYFGAYWPVKLQKLWPRKFDLCSGQSRYSGQCLTTYQTNKKAYGKTIATAVANACTLYFGQPEQDPCHCAQQFVSNRAAGMDLVDLAAAFHPDYKNTVYSPGGCTSPTCSPYCCSYPKSYCRKGTQRKKQ